MRSELQAAEAEDVIPIRMHRLRGVALVADRFRHEAVRIVRAHFLDVARRLVRLRPEVEGVRLGDEVDEFAVAVVLRNGIGAAAVDCPPVDDALIRTYTRWYVDAGVLAPPPELAVGEEGGAL